MSVAVIRALPNSIMALYFTGMKNPHNSAPPYSRAMRRAHRGRTQLFDNRSKRYNLTNQVNIHDTDMNLSVNNHLLG